MAEIPDNFSNYNGWKPQNVMRDIDALKEVARSQAQSTAKLLSALAKLERDVEGMRKKCSSKCDGDSA